MTELEAASEKLLSLFH